VRLELARLEGERQKEKGTARYGSDGAGQSMVWGWRALYVASMARGFEMPTGRAAGAGPPDIVVPTWRCVFDGGSRVGRV